jgi:N-acyl amino acid synthase of PEP-CTERM/exosortase system
MQHEKFGPSSVASSVLTAEPRLDATLPPRFEARMIDHDPALLEQSYRLRYQVYCVERGFLNASDYPDERETDAFEADSVHVGAVDSHGDLAGTARVIKPNSRGLPMFDHCTLFPQVRTLEEAGTVAVEVSRVAISRHYVRRRDDPPANAPAVATPPVVAVDGPRRERRRRGAEPFLTLVKAIMQGAKRAGATHVIGATDAAFHRWLVHYGLPYRVVGPEVDYCGIVAPCIMSLLELDQVILGGRFAALNGFPVGMDPSLW